jgi:hypothetical protein
LPWETTDQYIHSGHRSPDEFKPESLRTITLNKDEGIKAVIGKRKGKATMEVQSYLFDLSKGCTLDKAKVWFEQHHKSEALREHFFALLLFKVLEKIVDKPLRIRGIAMTAGMSRNFNIYVPEELQCMLISPIQRHFKGQVEHEIFGTVLVQSGLNHAEAQVLLNCGSERAPKVAMAGILKTAELV